MSTRQFLAALAVASIAVIALASSRRTERPWSQILGPSQAKLPEAMKEITWRTDFAASLREAREANRPLFVTLRCLPCKQCQSFDQAVLEGGPELEPLLAQFITVRLTSARDLDLRAFPVEGWQDLDLSWWGYLMSPDARIYAIFGGKDEKSDTSRISPAALAETLRRVLEHHYDPRRVAWDVDGRAPELSSDAPTPTKLAGYASWSKPRAAQVQKDGCLHCHQVAEILRQPSLDAKTFDKSRDLDVWPLPENVGLELERDDGLIVRQVAAGSAAERAGLKSHDRLAAAGDRKLFGQADFRGVLHRGPRGAGAVEVRWWRGAELKSGELQLADGWRKTVLGWRMSVSQGNVGATTGFAWPLACKPEQRRKLGVRDGTMAIKPFFGDRNDWPAQRAGLTDDDVIIAVGNQAPDLVQRDFLSWFRMKYEPGDEVVLTVRDSRGREREIRYAAPAQGAD